MNKLLACILIASAATFVATDKRYSTTSVITLVGSVIKTSYKEDAVEKYKRKDCPVFKGKGWYLSGDGIAKISCQYCEPE